MDKIQYSVDKWTRNPKKIPRYLGRALVLCRVLDSSYERGEDAARFQKTLSRA